MKQFGIIILAAGASSRLGRPKQLLSYKGKTLVERAADTAQSAGSYPVVLVTGAEKEMVNFDAGLHIVHNENWEEGIASSIRCGLNELLKIEPGVEAVLFLVCDQPHISAALLKQLIDGYHNSGKEIIACSYAGTVGIPAVFGKSFFEKLLGLRGDEGAKRIIMQNAGSVALVEFEGGEIDIDTAGDYAAL